MYMELWNFYTQLNIVKMIFNIEFVNMIFEYLILKIFQ